MNDTHHKLHHFKLGVSTKLHTNVHNSCISLVLYNVQKKENCVGVGETWPKIRCSTGDKEGFSLKVQVVSAT